MRAEERNILFFDWFIKYYPKGLEDVNPKYQELEIKVLSQKWVIPPNRKDKVNIHPIRCQNPTRIFTENLTEDTKTVSKSYKPKKISTSLLKETAKDHKEIYSDKISKHLDQDKGQQDCLNYFLNLVEK